MRRRSRLAALAAVALLCVAIAPVASAGGAHGATFGANASIHKTTPAKAHVPSMAAVGAAAALHPRQVHPTKLPTLKAGFTPAAGAARTTAQSFAPAIIATPDVSQLTSFAGATQAEAGGWTPADPWVAANTSFVIQVVNNLVRVTTRTGSLLTSVPSEAFYNVPAGRIAADSRIIWDAVHGRWVGEVVWFAGDLSDNGFTLAISDGADPTLGWSLITIGYSAYLPDFPSLASSSDKIVVADDIYDSGGLFVSADVNTFTWASILAGGLITYNFCDDSGFGHPRVAQVLSGSNDVHLIMEATDGSGDQWYFRLVGAGICTSPTFQILDGLDLASLGMPGIQVPPAPRQVGSDTIDHATDGRATDAVWQNGHLWWVATAPVTYDAGATFNDAVAIYTVNTVSSGPPSTSFALAVDPGDGIDAYMGGIGLTRGGTPIVVYSQSSSTTPVAMYANRIDPGLSLGTPLLLDTGDGAITGERWGDYAGVATDPTGTGATWATQMVAAGDGTWRTRIVRLVVDNDLPTTPGAPAATLLVPSVAPKLRLSWGAATDGASGSVLYRLEQNVDSAGFVLAGFYTSPSTTRSVYVGHTYQYRVAAVDPLGHLGSFAAGPVLHPSLAQSPTSKTGTWGNQIATPFSGGSSWYSGVAGSTASYTTTGLRSIAIVTTKATSRGSFRVYIDGVLKATISCYATSSSFRQIVYQYTWSVPGTHTIKIYVLGTAGHPRVDVDAFLIDK